MKKIRLKRNPLFKPYKYKINSTLEIINTIFSNNEIGNKKTMTIYFPTEDGLLEKTTLTQMNFKEEIQTMKDLRNSDFKYSKVLTDTTDSNFVESYRIGGSVKDTKEEFQRLEEEFIRKERLQDSLSDLLRDDIQSHLEDFFLFSLEIERYQGDETQSRFRIKDTYDTFTPNFISISNVKNPSDIDVSLIARGVPLYMKPFVISRQFDRYNSPTFTVMYRFTHYYKLYYNLINSIEYFRIKHPEDSNLKVKFLRVEYTDGGEFDPNINQDNKGVNTFNIINYKDRNLLLE